MQPPKPPSLRRERIGIIVLCASAAVAMSPAVGGGARDRSTALAAELAARGITAAPGDVAWVDPPRGELRPLGVRSRAVARGAVRGEPTDLYLVDTRLSPEGVLLDVRSVHNLTETSGADESRPVLRGESLAYISRPLIEAASPTVHVLDLDGQRLPRGADWTAIERIQHAITSWQATGRLRGIGRRTFAIDMAPGGGDAGHGEPGGGDPGGGEPGHNEPGGGEPGGGDPGGEPGHGEPGHNEPGHNEPGHGEPGHGEPGGGDPGGEPGGGSRRPANAGDVAIALEDDSAVVVRAGGHEARLPLRGEDVPLPPWIRAEAYEVARPGNLVTWAVDRVRLVIGDAAMQTVKAVAFTALDFVLRNKEAVTGDTGAEDIAQDLGQSTLDPPVRQIPIDPEIGWPPAPLQPWVTPALPGEGQWKPQGGDAFVRKLEGLPPAFMTTFIRADRSRKATRVYIALWDPRQVELHMMAGTVEPKGATGEAGPGLIPRTPEVMKRVVAASNAGFQAMHGEFGMMADGVVYLPPKPYAATVAVRRDGSTVFGTWSEDETIPEWMRSYRQNMTVMVQDEKWNPFGRTWWGGTPPGWADKTHTVRTGICLTKERFVAYFYGADISPEALARAMIQTRCSYGLALDMNAGHSGLEFYQVAPSGELPPLGRPLQGEWEAEGDVSGLSGYRFRGRRLIRGMGLMNFPRYIRREARDFFYMTLRHLLPGPSLTPRAAPAVDGEGVWRTQGLPQHGFPYALATTEIRPDPARPDVRLRVLKVDPRTVVAAPASEPASAPPAGIGATVAVIGDGAAAPGAGRGELSSIWHSAGAFSASPTAPVRGAVRIATGRASSAGAVAALGVNDEDGMLIYVERAAPGPSGAPTPGPSGAPTPALSPDASAPPAAPVDPRDAKLLHDFLAKLGCSSRIYLHRPLAVALGGDTDLSGAAVHPPTGPRAVRLTRAEAPGAGRMFESTPIVPHSVWYPLQQKRVRYFKKPKKEETADRDR
ncbi:hypothetical protein [Sorangium sp. So ce513]|uniref:hypothetical protein n=1 Tax=Sorangium sp. So ce513 TaxID=3133315 RepID=UPI003F603749